MRQRFPISNAEQFDAGQSSVMPSRREGVAMDLSAREVAGAPWVPTRDSTRVHPAMADGYRFLLQGTPGPPAFLLTEVFARCSRDEPQDSQRRRTVCRYATDHSARAL